MSKTISRKRIVELMRESTEAPYQFDDGWIFRFMQRLQEEDAEFAAAVVRAADEKVKELNDKAV